ncbi:Gfo/Idh/MocA family protein [Paenibacillus sp. MBLB4367]|uniref:Gfo/Idh/MocA family protein n=1 Tax=Paenibacillus sp. MBLB4367 TaxID=3384767 RepID=UPI003908380D
MIKVGLIGLGRFSIYHLQSIRQIPGVSITAVADLNPERVESVQNEYGCAGYTDWRRMLEEEQLDAVTVLTPEHIHEEPVVTALQAGCHVFVEKPLAIDSEACERMIAEAEKANKLLMVGHVCRFGIRQIEMKRTVDSGKLGNLRSIYGRRNNGSRYFPIYRRVDPVYILGIHDIDLMHWLSGSSVTEVFAHSSGPAEGGIDLQWAMLKFASGMMGIVESSWLVPNGAPAEVDVRMEVVGERGTVHFQEPDDGLAIWGDETTENGVLYDWQPRYGRVAGALLEELHHFYDCVRSGRKSDILLPEDALAAVRVAEAVVLSCQTGKPVLLG